MENIWNVWPAALCCEQIKQVPDKCGCGPPILVNNSFNNLLKCWSWQLMVGKIDWFDAVFVTVVNKKCSEGLFCTWFWTEPMPIVDGNDDDEFGTAIWIFNGQAGCPLTTCVIMAGDDDDETELVANDVVVVVDVDVVVATTDDKWVNDDVGGRLADDDNW